MTSGVPLDVAYATCLHIAREHDENFPVASRLLPRGMRPHIAAIYAFARTADDFADEGDDPASVRLAHLDDWGRRLRAPASDAAPGPRDLRADAIFAALAHTIVACGIDVNLLDDLLSAFRQDVTVSRYEDWDRLLEYCRRSANPVGRLVLAVAGCRTPEAEAASDALCTALQLTNFWQDLEIDWRKGRLYVPVSIIGDAGADERDLDRGLVTPAWRRALREVIGRTRELYEIGRAVPGFVDGRLRWELRATWLGGRRILDRIERSGFDVFQARPTLGWRDAAVIGCQLLVFGFTTKGTKDTKNFE